MQSYELVISINISNFSIALPLSNDSIDFNAPSWRLSALPVATKAEAEFKITTSLNLLFLPLNNSIISIAFSSGSPPTISDILAVGRSISDGFIENSFISPFLSSAQ